MIFIIYDIDSELEIETFSTLEEISCRIEWQDILCETLTILDENGDIYAWDSSRKDEYATVYDYTLIKISSNLDLAEKCNKAYLELGQPDEFIITKYGVFNK